MSATKPAKDVGVTSEKGRRRTMEDAHAVVDGGFLGSADCGLYAVFDGHGGRAAAEWAAAHVPALVSDAAAKDGAGLGAAAFAAAFRAADAGLQAAGVEFAGCTATVCVVQAGRTLHVANVGDTHALLCTAASEEGAPPRVQRLTAEHRCADPAEVARVQAHGGFVVDGRVNGMLAVTRSLGDLPMKDPPYVTCEPACASVQLCQQQQQTLIVACDGLWDVVGEMEAAQAALAIPEARPAARDLLGRALKAGSQDNITIMVIKL